MALLIKDLTNMTASILLLVAGMSLVWFGGTLFVTGSVWLARYPVAVIGVTTNG